MATTLLVTTPVLEAVIARLQDGAEGLNAHFEAQISDPASSITAQGLTEYGAYPVDWENSLAVGADWTEVADNSDRASFPIVTVSQPQTSAVEDRAAQTRFQGLVNIVVEHVFEALEDIPSPDIELRQALAASLVVDATLGVFDPTKEALWTPTDVRLESDVLPVSTRGSLQPEGDDSKVFYVTTTTLSFDVCKR